MYTLSRVLPDGTERLIVAGPPGRHAPDDPAACEFLPGETVRIHSRPSDGHEPCRPTPIAELLLDPKGNMGFVPGKRDCSPWLAVKPGGLGELEMAVFDGGDTPVALLRYLDDVRVFIQVFPNRVPEEPAPVV